MTRRFLSAARKISSNGPSAISHGLYFGTFFKIIEPGEEPAGLGLFWAKENADWKIIAFQMDET